MFPASTVLARTPTSEQEDLPAVHSPFMIVIHAEELPVGIIELIDPPGKIPAMLFVEVIVPVEEIKTRLWSVGAPSQMVFAETAAVTVTPELICPANDV